MSASITNPSAKAARISLAAATTQEPTKITSHATLIDEAMALKSDLHNASVRAGKLVAAVRRQRKQSQVVQATLASLRQLQQVSA
jgi:hypothetical protein